MRGQQVYAAGETIEAAPHKTPAAFRRHKLCLLASVKRHESSPAPLCLLFPSKQRLCREPLEICAMISSFFLKYTKYFCEKLPSSEPNFPRNLLLPYYAVLPKQYCPQARNMPCGQYLLHFFPSIPMAVSRMVLRISPPPAWSLPSREPRMPPASVCSPLRMETAFFFVSLSAAR